jgi:histidinol-phosphate aminotransferase
VARPETIARIAPYRPPGSVSTVSVTLVTEALADPSGMIANVERVDTERDRLSAALREAGWNVGPTVTNFVLVDFGTTERAARVATGMLRRGLVPRTFPAGHPLAHALRLTIRDRTGNDRLIEVARELRPELEGSQT